MLLLSVVVGWSNLMELRKILYAEDEPDIQTIVQIALWAFSKVEIKICDNGQLLLDCVGSYKPDLILLDIMMPVMDGMATFRNLKLNEKTKDIPVVFITAKAQIQELDMYKSMGILGVIVKPFDPTALASKINELWDIHQSGNGVPEEVIVL